MNRRYGTDLDLRIGSRNNDFLDWNGTVCFLMVNLMQVNHELNNIIWLFQTFPGINVF